MILMVLDERLLSWAAANPDNQSVRKNARSDGVIFFI